ncbi:unnamed protein product [Ranitomeya imitator]|uniref:ABC transmembrane type-1 domain-containing protein n=1 Tax=Ranitomeya imitator TaxID=111125 RepID=A0ABN9LZB5_9NEOB|nr:unnamed protein product [Ranitomeya imitator]
MPAPASRHRRPDTDTCRQTPATAHRSTAPPADPSSSEHTQSAPPAPSTALQAAPRTAHSLALRLSNTAMGKTTTGQIVNLLSNDVNKFDQVTIFLHFLWAGPLQAIAVTVLLWIEIGPSCLAGMAVLIILMPLQTVLGKFFTSLRGKTAAFTDTRIRTMNEVISGMRIIKMYAWEQSFTELVNDIRKKEISKVLISSYLRGINLASFFVASKVIVFVTFTTYVLLGNVISASRVFVAVSLYGAVRLTVTLFFPSAIERVSEAKVSIRRIKLSVRFQLYCNIYLCKPTSRALEKTLDRTSAG